MKQTPTRERFSDYLGHGEVVIYSILAVLLALTALVTIASAGKMLWDGLSHWSLAAQTLRVLNELLIVLMLVEILHTVRISIRSHMLVITLEAATLSKEGAWVTDAAKSIFHSTMIELGLLGLLVLILVYSITLLRRGTPPAKDLEEM